jgi:CubicO group peptidase (beta-lactamase class C family)
MATRYKGIATIMIVLTLAAGCVAAEPAATPMPPTVTPIPPTATAVLPTDTPVPPTATALPPTATSIPPTATPIPPAITPMPPTHTPIPPTAEPSPTVTPTPKPGVTGDTWFKTYGGDQDNVGWDALLADDGGFFIVGTTNLEFEPEQQGDIYLIRTNAAGEILWEKTYGGQGYEEGVTAFQTSDGGLIISGMTNSFGAGGMDVYLIKVDQDGNELWSKTFGGPLDEMAGAWPMDDGGYILGGNIVDPNDVVADPGAPGYGGFAGRSNIYLARTDADSNELWSCTFGGENNVLAGGAVQTPDGSVLILATIVYFPDSGDDILLLKVDENGNEVWSRTWEQGTLSAEDLIETSDGNYLISASYTPPEITDHSEADFLFIKVDPEGNEIWTSIFGAPGVIDYGAMLVEAADGGYVAAGGTGRSLLEWDEDIVLIKINENGQLLWQQIIETDTHNMFGTMFQHPDGGYVIVGSTARGRQFDIFLIKTDAQGNVTAASEPAATAPALPPHWPTEGWRTSTPEEQGMDSELLAEAIDFLLQQNIHSLLIIRNGYIVADATFYPFTPGTKHDVASVTKSWTATLVGIAIHQGYIASVQQPVLDFFPQRTVANLDASKEAMTVEDLLTMRTGLECIASPTEATQIEMMASPDWVQFTLDLPMSAAPGTRWVYCSPGTHLLQAIIQQATGMSTLDFAQEHLFNPLGISDVVWPTDPQGIIRGYGDIRLAPRDMAKLGYLYLNEGLWEGQQLLPASWVEAATSAPEGAQPEGVEYGYLWWLSPDFYSAQGRGGQWIIVSPDQNMIVVLTNGRTVSKLLSSYIFPAAKSTSPLPPNPDGVALLESKIAQAAEPPQAYPQPVPPLPAIAQEVSGQTYALETNPFGLLTMSLTLQEQAEALLRITTGGGTAAGVAEFEWLAGLDGVERIAPGRFGIPAASKGSWESDNLFVIEVDEIGNSFKWRFSLAFEDDRVSVAIEDLTGFFPDIIRFGGKIEE